MLLSVSLYSMLEIWEYFYCENKHLTAKCVDRLNEFTKYFELYLPK